MSNTKYDDEKYFQCGCKTGCINNRCGCKKSLEFCDEQCSCITCKNPLNGKDLTKYSLCALEHMELINKIPIEKLEETFLEPPCGDDPIKLIDALGITTCTVCETEYFFSFCWEQIVQDDTTIHCEICGECRDWRGRHCENCNRCTYGLTVECEYCGMEGPYSDW